MEEYDLAEIDKIISGKRDVRRKDKSVKNKSANYFAGLVAGLVTSVLLAGIAAYISCLMKIVFNWFLVIPVLFIGVIVQLVSKCNGFISCLIAAVCGAVAAVVFTLVMESYSLTWIEGTRASDFMVLFIIGAAAGSGWICSKKII